MLKVDPLFTEAFFQAPANPGNVVSLDFPLPTADAAQLPTFLRGDQGQLFRNGFSALLARIDSWAAEQGITHARRHLDVFKKTFVDYDGKNSEINQSRLQLYRDGLQTLNQLIELLNEAKINIELKKGVISVMVANINVCGPGAYTHIVNAYTQLQANLDLMSQFQLFKTTAIQKSVKEYLQKRFVINDLMEIHYINAFYNEVAQKHGLPIVQDDYIRLCNDTIISDEHKHKFKRSISKNLNLDALIYEIINKDVLSLGLFKDQLQADSNAAIEGFSLALGCYGEDDTGNFSCHSLIHFEADIYQQTWDASLWMFFTVYRRLIFSKFAQEPDTTVRIDENKKLHFSCDRSLLYAYIEDGENKKAPLVPYLATLISLDRDHGKKNDLDDIVNSIKSHFSNDMKIDLVHYLFKFLESSDFALFDESEKNNIYANIQFIIRNIIIKNHFRIIKSIKAKYIDFYLSCCKMESISGEIQSINDFLLIYNHANDKNKKSLYADIFPVKAGQLVSSLRGLIDVLNICDNENLDDFVRNLNHEKLKSIFSRIDAIRFFVSAIDKKMLGQVIFSMMPFLISSGYIRAFYLPVLYGLDADNVMTFIYQVPPEDLKIIFQREGYVTTISRLPVEHQCDAVIYILSQCKTLLNNAGVLFRIVGNLTNAADRAKALEYYISNQVDDERLNQWFCTQDIFIKLFLNLSSAVVCFTVLSRFNTDKLTSTFMIPGFEKDFLASIKQYSAHPSYLILLMAAIRGYQFNRNKDKRDYSVKIGLFSFGYCRSEKLAMADKLEIAMRDRNAGFFKLLDPNEKKILFSGSLGEIAKAFQQYLISDADYVYDATIYRDNEVQDQKASHCKLESAPSPTLSLASKRGLSRV